ncbi:prepilin peptidase [Halodesulfovibrio marinisediminis]|uniref:Prepilin leader peptidase/N-methyltransferase n=1 Tax=Halodesulfovibrio marinisediminis DSM 17456 TaxID=1121457 RepID=A0A1N6FV45_9BACT|nr:A24 family peptidase [Halodesulfovibrio marinisediminis]SIN99090.1 leader peptidase (prepilin peptidase) / N-methyltransferase [Halodesulfovibrio marinisediminis DSM 17456]
MYILFAALLGLILGSFYSVCASRYGTGKTIIKPARSECPQCGHQLSVLENIPLVSFIIQKGRCKHCGVRIPFFYPLIEIFSMAWAVLAALHASSPAEWGALMIIGGICLVASAIDLQTFLLPDVLTYPGAVVILAASYAGVLHIDFIQSLLGAFIGAFALWAVAALYKLIRKIDGMGFGDVKFMLMLGALTGLDHLSIFVLIASLCALLFSIISLRKKVGISTTYIPFGPFLASGALLTYLYGNQIAAAIQ